MRNYNIAIVGLGQIGNYLYNEINTNFNNTTQTINSIIYSYFDNKGIENAVIQTNIN